jgi:predicted nucleic acid-binding protein
LLEQGRDLYATSYVLVETVTLLQHRIGLSPVRDLEDHLMPILSIEWVSDQLHRRGMGRLVREDRRRLSLVDCVSFEFMGLRGLRDVLTLDGHFAEAGFRVLPATRR